MKYRTYYKPSNIVPIKNQSIKVRKAYVLDVTVVDDYCDITCADCKHHEGKGLTLVQIPLSKLKRMPTPNQIISFKGTLNDIKEYNIDVGILWSIEKAIKTPVIQATSVKHALFQELF